ncbi:UDP-glucosyltransferase 2-like [Daktulosphaira vitifoliae]|uniref:UDP-glucosyltransferase 2-like n=1 Tax=Daktulosphaira vitifoliae TaxID=58002 RepID=UPI0021AA0F48|nr:UDP-glucosyltransferase 2-like [Daktulosphaira vitifoliae]
MNFVSIYIIFILHYFMLCNGAKILSIESIAGKSHWNFLSSVLNELSTEHEVTVLTPFLDGNRENYTEINSESLHYLILDLDITFMFKFFKNPIMSLLLLTIYQRKFCDRLIDHEFVKKIIRGEQKFDIIVLEPFWSSCTAFIGHKLGIPQIYVVPTPIPTQSMPLYTGLYYNPSYESHFSYPKRIPNGFYDRLSNTVLFLTTITIPWLVNTVQNLYNKKMYDIEELKHDPSLIFVNGNPITDVPKVLQPNVINVGGIHLKTPKEIPEDIYEFIESSNEGVIFFSFGSSLSMSTLPEKIEKAFKEAIAQLPQRVLWKYEGEMKDKPANVMTKKWFPQRDILLHPKVKLFISHGGISGMYEAVDAGIPVLGFPIFYDQPRNMANLVDIGMAISMDLFSVTKETLFDAINKIINDETYTKNAKEISIQFKDRHMSPAETVVYWTDYVIRHKGAPHLKLQALKLSWYQFFLLDVISVIVFPLLFILYILFKLNRIFFRDIKKNV